jgi:hypothetical protein
MNSKEAAIVAEMVAKQLAEHDKRITALIDSRIEAMVKALLPRIIEAGNKSGLTAANSAKLMDAIVTGTSGLVKRNLAPIVKRLEDVERQARSNR